MSEAQVAEAVNNGHDWEKKTFVSTERVLLTAITLSNLPFYGVGNTVTL